MESKKVATVRIMGNVEIGIAYNSLEELSKEIHEKLLDLHIGGSYGDVTVEFIPGKVVNWHFGMAHYCFDHGRIDEDRFVELQYFTNPDTGLPLEEVAE